MRRLPLLLALALIIAIPIKATAQSKTKKIEILTNEVKNLRKVVDSLQSIITNMIPSPVMNIILRLSLGILPFSSYYCCQQLIVLSG